MIYRVNKGRAFCNSLHQTRTHTHTQYLEYPISSVYLRTQSPVALCYSNEHLYISTLSRRPRAQLDRLSLTCLVLLGFSFTHLFGSVGVLFHSPVWFCWGSLSLTCLVLLGFSFTHLFGSAGVLYALTAPNSLQFVPRIKVKKQKR